MQIAQDTQDKQKKLVKKYPFIDELVDSLYTEQINDIINSENVQIDKRTFLMFITMYFVTRLNTDFNRESIKYFLNDIINSPDKRRKCIELFIVFENSINTTINGIGKIKNES